MLPAYLADKNALVKAGYKPCFEFLYDRSDPDPANWSYFRRTTYDSDITVPDLEQLGNPGTFIDTTFESGSPIGDYQTEGTSTGDMPESNLLLPNAASVVDAIDEHYDLHMMPVRVIMVHPEHLDDGIVCESVGQIVRVTTTNDNGIITVKPATFDPMTALVPRSQVRLSDWPGMVGARRFNGL